MLPAQALNQIHQLRKTLRENPEPSCYEEITKQILMDFLAENTQLTIVDKGRWFYALHREVNATETIAFRADFDAILDDQGQAFHGCGHDGHSAILCGLALQLDGQVLAKNIVFIFQHAEENAVGAKECCAIFDEIAIDRIYGLHNMPSYELNTVVLNYGTIQCASKGVSIKFNGKQAHASEPEKGINPAYAIAQLSTLLEPLAEFNGYQAFHFQGMDFSDLVMCTIVHTNVGNRAFGISPAQGEICLTIRSVREADLNLLQQFLITQVQKLSLHYGMSYEVDFEDEFPETTNNAQIVGHLEQLLAKNQLPYIVVSEPYRASEDYGYYLKRVKGCYIFLGSGVAHPNLHALNYEFPDELLSRGVEIFTLIARSDF